MRHVGAAVCYFSASFICSLVAAHTLPTNAFGASQYSMWLSQIAWLIASIGVPQALTRFIALWTAEGRADEVRALLRRAPWIVLISLTLAACGVGWMARHLNPIEALASAVLCAAVGFHSYWTAVMSGRNRYDAIFRATAPASLILVLVTYPATSRFGLAGYLLSQALTLGLVGAQLMRANHPGFISVMARVHPRTRRWLAPVTAYALSTWAALLVSAVVWQRGELYFIERFLGLAQVAQFSAALFLADMVCRPLGLAVGALLPNFVRQIGLGDRLSVDADFRLATKFLAWTALFPLAFLALNADEITSLVFGQRYAEAAGLARVLCIAAAIGVTALPGSSVIYAEGKAAFILKTGLAGAVLAVMSGLSVVPQWGSQGAAWTRTLIQGLMILANILYLARLGYRFPADAWAKCAVFAVSACALPALIFDGAGASVGALALCLLLALLLYAGATAVFPVLDTRERAGWPGSGKPSATAGPRAKHEKMTLELVSAVR